MMLFLAMQISDMPNGLAIMGAVCGGAVIIGQAAIRLAERAIDKKNDSGSSLHDICNRLDHLHEHHEALARWNATTDTDGTPMGWTPRRWGQTLYDIRNSLQALEHHTTLLTEIRDQLRTTNKP